MADHAGDSPIWRVLRLLLPRRFREEWGGEILRTHVDAHADPSAAGGLRFWAGVAIDLAVTGVRLRLESPWRGNRLVWPMGTTVRGLMRAPGYSLSVIGILTLGIGANLTVFTVLDRLFLSAPRHIDEPASLRRVTIHGTSPITGDEPEYRTSLTYPDYQTLAGVPGFERIAGFGAGTRTLAEPGDARRIAVELVTASYFPVLGVAPAVGRFFSAEEDRIGATDPVAVVSHGFWVRTFGADPGALGSQLLIGRVRYTVVGVAPPGFTGVDLSPVDVWLPFHTAMEQERGDAWATATGWYVIHAAVRVDEGDPRSTIEAATAAYRAGREGAWGNDPDARVLLSDVRTARGPAPPAEARVARFLAVLAGLVLLVSAANVGNLTLARAAARRREAAVRTALGASRAQLLVDGVAETGVLCLVAASLSVVPAWFGGGLIFRFLLPDLGVPTAVDTTLFAAATALASIAVVVAGLLPALAGTRLDVMARIRSTDAAPPARRARRVLLGAQTAFSVVILVTAGLFVQSARTAAGVDLGLDPDVLALDVETREGRSFGPDVSRVVDEVMDDLRRLPGVETVARTTLPPFSGGWGIDLEARGGDRLEWAPEGPFVYGVGSDFFDVVGLEVVAGRALTDADDAEGAAPVTVVGERLARRLWPEGDVVGRCLVPRPDDDDATCATVVGVVSDFLPAIDATTPNLVAYFAPSHAALGTAGAGELVVRPAPGVTAGEVARQVSDVSGEIRLVTPRTLGSLIEPQSRSWRVGAALLLGFGLLSLVVCGAGIYSAVAFEVARRRRELGVRMALGADSGHVVGAAVARTLSTLAVGVVLGASGGVVAGALGRALLFRVRPIDPPVLITVSVVLVAVGAVAAAIPSWRATRVDPTRVLRAE